MSKAGSILALAAVFSLGWMGGARALEIPLYIDESAGVQRRGEPVTTGVPLHRGDLQNLDRLSITGPGGGPVPAQFRTLSRWPDGSVRWVLVDFQAEVEPDGRAVYVLEDSGKGVAHAQAIRVDETEEAISVSSGQLSFAVSKGHFALFSRLLLSGAPVLGEKSGARLFTAAGESIPIEALPPDQVVVEEAGPLRTVIAISGRWGTLNEGRIEYLCRLTSFAGQPLVRVRFWLRNLGAYGYNLEQKQDEWFAFDGLSLDLDLAPMAGREALGMECEDTQARVGKRDTWGVAQYGEDPDYDSMSYTVEHNGRRLASGPRTDGTTRLRSGSAELTVAVRHFWQNYEKAITLDGDLLSIWLWPRFGEWPRTGISRGAIDEGPRQASTYHLPGGTQKSHEILLDLRPGLSAEQSAATLEQPLMALASAQHFAATEAVSFFAEGDFRPADPAAAAALANQDAWARQSFDPDADGSIHEARRGTRHGFWLGWMDFGDLNWDSARGRGPSSLHYDWTWIALLDYLRLRDRYFFDVGDEMARHRMDVDQRWSNRDHESYRGLCAFEMNRADIHGGNQDGHTSPTPTHNWISGLVLYHLLTGDAMSREAALRNCDTGIYPRLVERLMAGRADLNSQPRESGWSIANLVSAYELTGDGKYLDWATVCWDKHLEPRWRRDGVSFQGDQYGLQMFYCTHGLIGLHRWTQNPEILKYIETAVREVDVADRGRWQFGHELGIFFSDYWGYLAAVKEEPAYLLKGREYFQMRISPQPEERVFNYGNRTITKEVSKALRNGHVLQWAEKRLAGGACGKEPTAPILRVRGGAELDEAIARARPGTRVELAPGEYGGGHFFGNLRGEPGNPIVIAAADPNDPPTFTTDGGECLHLSDPVYVELHHLRLSGASGNGLNIDDGGSFDTPAHHVLLRGLTVTDIGPSGNRDGIKLSGLTDFRVEDCEVERWGDGGSAIDMVGCHRGEITGCLFRFGDAEGGSSIQAKGGSRDLHVHHNRFEHGGSRAVNIGGSTGLSFFRPQPEGFEARDILVENNVFIGSMAPIAFVGVDGSTVRFNTFYRPASWVLRILQETRGEDFVPSRNGVFTDNIVVFRTDELARVVNIGPDTAWETFRFERNFWYALDDPERSAPDLPTPEIDGVMGMDPLFVDVDSGDFHLLPDSPAATLGAFAIGE